MENETSKVKLTINRVAGIIVDQVKEIDQRPGEHWDNMHECRDTKIRAVEKRIYDLFNELSKIEL